MTGRREHPDTCSSQDPCARLKKHLEKTEHQVDLNHETNQKMLTQKLCKTVTEEEHEEQKDKVEKHRQQHGGAAVRSGSLHGTVAGEGEKGGALPPCAPHESVANSIPSTFTLSDSG